MRGTGSHWNTSPRCVVRRPSRYFVHLRLELSGPPLNGEELAGGIDERGRSRKKAEVEQGVALSANSWWKEVDGSERRIYKPLEVREAGTVEIVVVGRAVVCSGRTGHVHGGELNEWREGGTDGEDNREQGDGHFSFVCLFVFHL